MYVRSEKITKEVQNGYLNKSDKVPIRVQRRVHPSERI